MYIYLIVIYKQVQISINKDKSIKSKENLAIFKLLMFKTTQKNM